MALSTAIAAWLARALRWNSIDLDTGRCLIREAFKDQKEIGLPKWNKSREIKVPFSEKVVQYNPSRYIGVGVSRMGTSKAVSVGAYSFALNQLD